VVITGLGGVELSLGLEGVAEVVVRPGQSGALLECLLVHDSLIVLLLCSQGGDDVAQAGRVAWVSLQRPVENRDGLVRLALEPSGLSSSARR
jgi:hypothetical protein